MIVVSDTSAITALMQIGREELLLRRYSGVVIPEAVAEELKRAHAVVPVFIGVLRGQDRQRVVRLIDELDVGEAEAIALMLERRGDILLMDERRGRRGARREGVPLIGLTV
ncbi:MAG: hypothetical protein ACLQSR_12440 [Limisphaerales bacterium]